MLKLIFIAALLVICFSPLLKSEPIDLKAITEAPITVEVRGAVAAPGPYELAAASSIADLLDLIELTADADTAVLNPAIILKDKDVIDIPYNRDQGRISINTATVDELMTLKGIKTKLAAAIIAYRETNGLFQSLEELMEVKGIGEKKFAQLEPYIKL